MSATSKLIFSLSLLSVTAGTGLAQQNVYGCPVHPNGSIFYARIDSLPVLAQSATYTANMGSSSLTWDTSWGVTESNSHAPAINAQFNYTPGYNGSWRFPAPYVIDREGGSFGGNDGADHHSIVVESDSCNIWESYHFYVNPLNGLIQTGNTCNGKPCNAQSGWHYTGTSSALPTQGTTDAAGLPLLPLLWRAHEILDGTLNHPVRFTLGRSAIQAGNPQWPASGTNGLGGTQNPPYGERFRLKSSVKINISGLTAQQQIYAQTMIAALQRYGLVLADAGMNLNANVDDEAGQSPDIMAALNTVGSQIKPAQLEAVNMSSLQPATPSYLVAQSSPSSPSVMVGTAYRTFLNIQAGTTLQLSSWVNGPASSQAVNWDVTSGNIGTVTPSGLYTPPSSVAGITEGVLTVTALSDPDATSTVYVRVFPAGPIRIAAGLQSGTMTDALGQVWLRNVFFRAGDTVFRASDTAHWSSPSNGTQAAELNIYETFSYTYGNDQSAHMAVPNGTYSIRLMFGQPYNGSRVSSCSPFSTQAHNFIDIEVQNQIVQTNYDFGASINHACGVPVDFDTSATVTNNVLEFALRNAEPDGTGHTTIPVLNGVEIIRTK